METESNNHMHRAMPTPILIVKPNLLLFPNTLDPEPIRELAQRPILALYLA
jgi:hypothetical protein